MTRVTKLSRKELKQKYEEGWIKVSILFEMVGSPKEHIEKTLQSFLNNINEDEQIITLAEDIDETIEIDDSHGLFSAAAEVDYVVLGLDKLTWFAFNFMPASIEIKEPGELTFRDKDFSAWMNDLLARLHEVNTIHTALKSEHTELIKNLNAAIRNLILLTCENGADIKEVAKKSGMSENAVLPFLDAMEKNGKLSKKGKTYTKK